MGAVKQSVAKLRAIRPGQIRKEAQRRFRVVLLAESEAGREALSQVLLAGAGDASSPQRQRALGAIVGAEVGADAARHHAAKAHAGAPIIAICTPAAASAGAGLNGAPLVVLDPADPQPGLLALLRAYPGLRLALARTFPPLQDLLARELIRAVAVRNATVAAISALPDVIPTPLSLLLALGEFGSDTVVITGNQIGLAFELAAVRGETVAWGAQARPVLGIMAAGLGWRALARELVGLIPAGIGLTAKAAIAYSGTVAVGTALWRPPRPRLHRSRPKVELSSTRVAAHVRLASRQQSA